MIRYLITDGSGARDPAAWIKNLECWMGRVEIAQIRERELSARELETLVRRACARRGATKVLVNDRVDIAIGAGADGIHLRDGAVAPGEIRKIAPPQFIISAACHDSRGVLRAADEGADYILLGPIFAPLSKPENRSPVGLETLRNAAASVTIPVIALGGITEENAPACIAAGAAGVAGISLFSRRNQ